MAVYTELDEVDIRQFLKSYNTGVLKSFEGIEDGVENTNYHIDTTHGPFILTVYEKRTDAKALDYIAALMNFLDQKGFLVPRLLNDNDKNMIQTIKDKPAALVQHIEGNNIKDRLPEVHECRSVGSSLARIHKATISFSEQRDNPFHLEYWTWAIKEIAGDADSLQPGLYHRLMEEINFLKAEWGELGGMGRGAIHGDAFPNNAMFKQKFFNGLIDFNFACTDYFAYDLAITINAWCFNENHKPDMGKVRALLSSYQTFRSLNAEEKDNFQLLCRAAAMRFVASRLYDWFNTPPSALVEKLNPLDYVAILDYHQKNDLFQKTIETPRTK